MTDILERLFSPDAMSAEKTVKALHSWPQKTMDEVRLETQLVFAEMDVDEDNE